MLKMKLVLLLILLLFIVDCKKLRNKLKTKNQCKQKREICGTFSDECCDNLFCFQRCFMFICLGVCS